MRFDINNIEFQTSDNILLSVLNEKAPLKQKNLRANNTGFITKDIRKTNKKRSSLWKHFAKHKTEPSRIAYNKHRNLCTSLLRKPKAFYFQNLDSKDAIVSAARRRRDIKTPLCLSAPVRKSLT